MQARAGYFSFILAFFLCTAMLFAYLATMGADTNPDARSFLVEKRFYAVSDMQYSQYQIAQLALADAKNNTENARDLLKTVAPEVEIAIPKESDRDIAKAYVLLKLQENSEHLKSVYGADYDILFWCGPVGYTDLEDTGNSMILNSKATAPKTKTTENPALSPAACMDYVIVRENKADGSWYLDFTDTSGNVLAITQFSLTGIGLSIYDVSLNQSSIHIISRLRDVRA